MNHPASNPDSVDVVTGGASGIGLAAATKFAGMSRRRRHRNRPALSRWHPDYTDAFKAFIDAKS